MEILGFTLKCFVVGLCKAFRFTASIIVKNDTIKLKVNTKNSGTLYIYQNNHPSVDGG